MTNKPVSPADEVGELARQILEAILPVNAREIDMRAGTLRVLDASGADVTVAVAADLREACDAVLTRAYQLQAAAEAPAGDRG